MEQFLFTLVYYNHVERASNLGFKLWHLLYQLLWYVYLMTDLDMTSEVTLNFSINGSTVLTINVWYGTTGILIKEPLKLKDVCRISSKESGINKISLKGSWKELKIVWGNSGKKCMMDIHKTLVREYLRKDDKEIDGEKRGVVRIWPIFMTAVTKSPQ